MPIYEFECLECGVGFEELVASMKSAKPACPKCKSKKTAKKISVFSPQMGSLAPEPGGCGMRPDGSCGRGGCSLGG